VRPPARRRRVETAFGLRPGHGPRWTPTRRRLPHNAEKMLRALERLEDEGTEFRHVGQVAPLARMPEGQARAWIAYLDDMGLVDERRRPRRRAA
jgi:hypothetical protein